MKLAIEVFFCSILISLLVLFGMYMNNIDIATGNAKQFCSAATNRIIVADNANEVIEACKKDAEKAGYQLNVNVVLKEGHEIPEVTLKYNVRIPLFQINKEFNVKQNIS